MRRKVNDITPTLPPGVGEPVISDDFGDVFGFQLALVGDGYTYVEMERFAKALRKELNVVEGVSRVDLWGVQQQVVYVDVAETQLSQLGISESNLLATLDQQNMVVDAGNVDIGARRLHTVLEHLLEELSFEAPDRAGEMVEVTAEMVKERLGDLVGDRDLARYIL